MGTAVTRTRHNRTITVDFHNETTYFQLLDDGKAFVEFVLAFLLALGFQLIHQATCSGGWGLAHHPPLLRRRLGGVPPLPVQWPARQTRFTGPSAIHFGHTPPLPD